MAFSVIAIRGEDDEPTPLHPDPGELPDSIAIDHHDGHPNVHEVSEIVVTALDGGRPRQTAKLSELKATLTVTDSRVAVACSSWDKGGGWSGFSAGGLAVALVANGVSKSRAKRRRAGRMLVGHVRYDWLAQVEAKDRTGLLTSNNLQLLLADPQEPTGMLILGLTLGKRETATGIAADIASRAARRRARRASAAAGQEPAGPHAHQPTPEPLGNGRVRFALA
jgi:hypothetical protein